MPWPPLREVVIQFYRSKKSNLPSKKLIVISHEIFWGLLISIIEGIQISLKKDI